MSITTIIIILVVAGLLIYDVFAIAKWGMHESVSYKIYDWSFKFPLIPFAFGLLMGHFFWPVEMC